MARTITLQVEFAAWLAARQVVTAAAGDRVWPWGEAPQDGGFPRVLFAVVGGDRLRSTRGPTTRVAHPRYQIDVVAQTHGAAAALAEAIALDIEDNLRGASLDGHRVQSARCKLPTHTAGDPAFGDELAEPRQTILLDLWFEEG